MRLTDYPLLTDENIDPAVVRFLRNAGFDVRDVSEDQLNGCSDQELLSLSVIQQRVIVTHDSDFGTLAILQQHSVVGLLYLRPGHIDSTFTIGSVEALLDASIDLPESFIILVRRRNDDVTIRVRNLTLPEDSK